MALIAWPEALGRASWFGPSAGRWLYRNLPGALPFLLGPLSLLLWLAMLHWRRAAWLWAAPWAALLVGTGCVEVGWPGAPGVNVMGWPALLLYLAPWFAVAALASSQLWVAAELLRPEGQSSGGGRVRSVTATLYLWQTFALLGLAYAVIPAAATATAAPVEPLNALMGLAAMVSLLLWISMVRTGRGWRFWGVLWAAEASSAASEPPPRAPAVSPPG
jgi:hypothetical protein